MTYIKLEDVNKIINEWVEEYELHPMKERINSLPQYNPEDGWIPVTERLPEEWCYLAFSDGIMYVTATWNDSIFWNAWEIVSWVTHWMPLPLPPITK